MVDLEKEMLKVFARRVRGPRHRGDGYHLQAYPR